MIDKSCGTKVSTDSPMEASGHTLSKKLKKTDCHSKIDNTTSKTSPPPPGTTSQGKIFNTKSAKNSNFIVIYIFWQ